MTLGSRAARACHASIFISLLAQVIGPGSPVLEKVRVWLHSGTLDGTVAGESTAYWLVVDVVELVVLFVDEVLVLVVACLCVTKCTVNNRAIIATIIIITSNIVKPEVLFCSLFTRAIIISTT